MLGQVIHLDASSSFPFGKYRELGTTVEEVVEEDPGYIRWWDENVSQYKLPVDLVELAGEYLMDDYEPDDGRFGALPDQF